MDHNDRINPEQERRQSDVKPIVERRVPQWIQRMQRDGLPPKDLTGKAA